MGGWHVSGIKKVNFLVHTYIACNLTYQFLYFSHSLKYKKVQVQYLEKSAHKEH
jgi:hypothetical protein